MFRLIVRLHGLKMQIIHGCRGHHHIPSAGHRLQHGAHIPRTVSQIVVENVIIFMGKHLLHLPGIRPVDDQTSDSVSKIIRRPARVLRSSPHVPGAKVPTPDVFRKIPFRPALKYSYVSPSFFFPFSVPFHTIILILRCFINNPPRTERQKTPQKGFSPRCRVSFTSRYFFFYLKYSTPDSNSLKSCSP